MGWEDSSSGGMQACAMAGLSRNTSRLERWQSLHSVCLGVTQREIDINGKALMFQGPGLLLCSSVTYSLSFVCTICGLGLRGSCLEAGPPDSTPRLQVQVPAHLAHSTPPSMLTSRNNTAKEFSERRRLSMAEDIMMRTASHSMLSRSTSSLRGLNFLVH
jgi:hypothetical protein